MKVKLYWLVVIIYILPSCKPKLNSEDISFFKKLYGKEVILPYIANNDSIKPKIVTCIDGGCSVCIDELLKWKIFLNETEGQADTYFYMQNIDSCTFNYINDKYINFNYPIIYDSDSKFLILNDLRNKKPFQTFLLDKNNEIILLGNPINNTKLSTLYKSEIHKILSNK